MSERLSGDPDLDDRAGEYVLGADDAATRRAIEADAAANPALAGAIAWWETRLHPLTALVAPVAPPADLWARIEAALGAAVLPFRAAPAQAGRRALAAWRAAALAATAVAAGLAFLLIRQPPPATQAVLLPLAAKPAGFLASVEADRVTIAPLAGLPRQPDHDYELWGLPAGAAAPVPIGVLPRQGTATLALAPLAQAHGHIQLLVSLEPAGGSPTNLPTGPVLYGTEIVRD